MHNPHSGASTADTTLVYDFGPCDPLPVLMLIVKLKDLLVAMWAGNKGEGDSFALLALIARHVQGRRLGAARHMLGVLAASLF